jgi:hypothetical protein
MLPSQLAPFELVYLDQQGVEVPVADNADRVTFDTFALLVTHLKDHPNFNVAEYTRVGVGFTRVDRNSTDLIGAMVYARDLNGDQMKVTSFKVRGPIPDLSVDEWYLSFNG